MAPKTWQGGTDNWTTDADWNPAGRPGSGDDVVVSTGDPQITSNVGTIGSLDDSAAIFISKASLQATIAGALEVAGATKISGSLQLEDGGAFTADSGILNSGHIAVDEQYQGGTVVGGAHLTIHGTLTSTSSGTLTIGNPLLSVASSADVDALVLAGTGHNDNASVFVQGTTSAQASLNIASQAGFGTAGRLTGAVGVKNNGLIQFAGGAITTIGAGSSLALYGSQASVSNGGAQNSALTSLATIESGGSISLEDGPNLTIGNGIANSGHINVDEQYQGGTVVGGASLTIHGTVTNAAGSSFVVGNSLLSVASSANVDALVVAGTGHNDNASVSVTGGSSTLASLNVASQAGFGTVGRLTGNIALSGDALIQFAGGAITTIGAGSSLGLYGSKASVSNGGAQNSAIATLATIESGASLSLEDGPNLTIGNAIANSGHINVDEQYQGGSVVGGSTLTVKGTLTDTSGGTLSIGNNLLSVPVTVSVQALDNQVGGGVSIRGNGSTAGELDVAGAAGFGTAGVLSGNVDLVGVRGPAVLQFDNGGITSIAAGSELTLDGTMASMRIAGGAQNGALTGLASIAGTLTLDDGAVLATGGAAAGAAGTLTIGNAVTVAGRINSATIDVASGGSLTLVDGGANAAVTVENGATLAGTGFAGNVTVAAGGTFFAGGDPGRISTGNVTLASGSTFEVDLGGTQRFGQDSVSGTVALGGATLSGAIVDGYAPAIGDTLEIISNDGTDAVTGTFAGLAEGAVTDIGGNGFKISYVGGDGNDVTLTDVGPVCFVTGTRIATARGEVAVEDLAVGDRAVVASGGTRPIRWIGHRTLRPAEQRVPSDVWPVRVLAGAFGPGRPARDLMLSPGHPVLVGADADDAGGHLVPIMCLINGTTIARVKVASVTYWHVELDAHDLLLAEGLPAESYLDWGDRAFFTEGADHALANPDFVVPGLAARCRPVALDGAVVEAERRRLDVVFAMRLAAASAWPSPWSLAAWV